MQGGLYLSNVESTAVASISHIHIYILYLLTFVDMLGDIIYIYIYIRIGHVHIDEGSNARHWHAR